MAERRKEAEAAKKVQEELAEKERIAEEAIKAKELQAEKDRLAEEAKNLELAEIEKKRKDAEAAKIEQEAIAEKERLAEEAKKAQEQQAEKDRLAEEAKKRELAELAQKEKKEAEAATEASIEKNDPTENKALNEAAVVFKVQLMASVKTIPLEASNFNGLDELSKEPIRNLFRYMYGNATTYEAAKMLKSNADSKGYTTSYIVAYRDGQRITVKEARKYVKE